MNPTQATHIVKVLDFLNAGVHYEQAPPEIVDDWWNIIGKMKYNLHLGMSRSGALLSARAEWLMEYMKKAI